MGMNFNMQASKLQDATQAVASSADGPKGQVEDLFSAHDFDIQIDLPTSNEGMTLWNVLNVLYTLAVRTKDSTVDGRSNNLSTNSRSVTLCWSKL